MLAVMVSFAQGEAGGWAVSAVLLCVAIPQIILAPLAAPLLDKFGPRRVVVTSATIQVALLLCVAAIPTTPVIIVIIAARSCIASLDSAALMLLADRGPRSEESETNSRAFARLDTARLVGGLIGPILGGIGLEKLGLPWLFLAQAGTIAVLGAVAVFYQQRQVPQPPPTSWWHRVREAPAILFRHTSARAALSGLVLAIIFTSLFSTAQPLFAVNVLALTPVGVAVMTQFFVLGRIIGSRLSSRLKQSNASGWLLRATVLMGVGLLLPGIAQTNVTAAVGFAIAGVANAVQVASIRLIVVGAVPEHTRGRALAAMGSVNQTAGVLGTALAAPTLALVGPPGALTVAGTGTVLAAALTAFLRLRNKDRERQHVQESDAE